VERRLIFYVRIELTEGLVLNMQQYFYETLANADLSLSERQRQQFEQYYDLLTTWNEKMNLTAITDKDLVYSKHFLDSASLAFFFDFTQVTTLCDVGSGAGFPAIVLKILFPHLQLTIVEALQKRLTFLEVLITELELRDVSLVHERAEIYGRTQREAFDVVSARAVARLGMLAELCVPLVKKDGYFIAMKGPQGREELSAATDILHTLGITDIREERFTLTHEDAAEARLIYVCHKTELTPQLFPRAFAQIKKMNN